MKNPSLLPELENPSADGLAHLLDSILDEKMAPLPEAPEDVFLYFLETPLSEWITDPELLRSYLESSGAGLNDVTTVLECLSSTKPPFELMAIIRDQARKHREENDSDTVVEAATALYFCTIASELNAYQTTKTGLKTDAVKKGLEWAQNLSWLTQEFKGLLGHARNHL
jgi:hypothetical protein